MCPANGKQHPSPACGLTWAVGAVGALQSPPSDGLLLFVLIDERRLLLKLHRQPEQHVVDLNHLVSAPAAGQWERGVR